MSIFERLGEERGTRAAVDDSCARVVGTPRLTHHFAGTDMDTLREHRTALLVQVTGGPAARSGRDPAIAHVHLGSTPDDLDRVVEHLVGTPTSSAVPQEDVGAVGEALTAHRDEIVPAPAPA